MEPPITGRCLCGSVRLVATAPPFAARACWCRDCQYLAAGNAAINVIILKDQLTVTGTISTYRSTADSGNAVQRSFCPQCGTPLFGESAAAPGLIAIRAGVLDDPSLARPEGFIWTERAPVWGLIDHALENLPRQTPPPA
jgi:hypothetical protein